MLAYILILCCLLLGLTFRLWYRWNFSYWSRHKSVASVPGQTLSGNLRDFLTFKTNFFYNLRTIYEDPKYAQEPVVGVYGLLKPGLLIKDPELIKLVLIKDFNNFCNRYDGLDGRHDPNGDYSLFFARYNIWKDVRSKMSPIFSGVKLKNMFSLIQNVGLNLEAYLMQQPREHRMDMKYLFANYTIDTIASTIFGMNLNSVKNPQEPFNVESRKMVIFNWKRAVDTIVLFFLPKWAPLLNIKFYSKDTNRFIKDSTQFMIGERERTGQGRNDLIDMFVKLKQEAREKGEDEDYVLKLLVAQSGQFLAAGFETSSTTMSNALLELAKQPELQEKLRQEILLALEEGEGEISYEALLKMEYLDMVIHETLRLYPVLPTIDRRCCSASGKAKPYSLQPYCDFDIPDGMPIYISAYGLHYDPQYWPNPTKFDPERFSPENRASHNPVTFLGFGNGPHNCLGKRLGLLQVKCGLLYMLRNHYVRVCEETIVEPQLETKAFILQVKGGIILDVVRDDMCSKEKKHN